MSREAMQQALEALESVYPYTDSLICYASTTGEHPPNAIDGNVRDAINALRAALAEPEQELGQALKRAIEHINELEALNAELVKALRQVEGIINLSPHALSITRTALMKAKLEYENEAR